MTRRLADLLAAMPLEAVRAERCRRSFCTFTEWAWPLITGAPLTWNLAIERAVDVLQRVADGELTRVLIAMPSGVGKSTLLCCYKAWRLARDPSHRVIAMMHSASLANTESLRLRRLVEGDAYRERFPLVQLRVDEQRVDAWATTRDGRHYAVGADSSLLGRRASEAICDDPLDTLDRFSRAAKESLWAWFSESLSTRLDGDKAPIIVVHQRLCIDDLIGRLIEQGGWHLLELPAETDDGELLAPTVLTREKLDGLKQQNPRAYAAMFLQRPSADDGAAIARTAWRFHVPHGGNMNAARPMGCVPPEVSPTVETPSSFDVMCISVDPTFGSLRGDYCSITVWGANGEGSARTSGVFLLDRWCHKAKQIEQRAQVKAMRAKYPGAIVLLELAAGGHGMLEELEAEGVTNIEGVTVGSTSGNKRARLELVSPAIERGEVYLGIGVPGLADFVECLAGATRHDDDQDSTSQALHWLAVHGTELSGAAAVAQLQAITRNLREIFNGGPRIPDPREIAAAKAESEAQRARNRAEKQRRRERLDKLEAKRARGEKLTRAEALHLRMWRGRKPRIGTSAEPIPPTEPTTE